MKSVSVSVLCLIVIFVLGGCSPAPENTAKKSQEMLSEDAHQESQEPVEPVTSQPENVEPAEPLFTDEEVETAKQMATDLGVFHLEDADGHIVTLDTSKNRSWVDDYQLLNLLKLEHLENLTVEGPGVTDEFTAALEGLPNLKSLTMKNTLISDVGVEKMVSLKNLKVIDLRLSPLVSDQAMETLASMPQLRAVRLSGLNQLNDAGLESLLHLPNMSELDVRNCRNLSKAAFEKLKAYKPLRTLKLGGSTVTDETLAIIATLSQLTGLSLDAADVSDAGVVQIGNLPLKDLTLYQCSGITDAGLECVASMGHLQRLTLRDLRVNAVVLGKLPNPELLRVLNVAQTNFGDEQAALLVQMTQLSELTVMETPLTDASVETLAKLTSLKKLMIAQTKMSPEGISQLENALPNCEIRSN